MDDTFVVVDCGQPEYLDGAAMQGEVRIGDADGAAIAYCEIEYANLFAAAPDMLKALKQITEELDDEGLVTNWTVIEALDAIEKATGSPNASPSEAGRPQSGERWRLASDHSKVLTVDWVNCCDVVSFKAPWFKSRSTTLELATFTRRYERVPTSPNAGDGE